MAITNKPRGEIEDIIHMGVKMGHKWNDVCELMDGANVEFARYEFPTLDIYHTRVNFDPDHGYEWEYGEELQKIIDALLDVHGLDELEITL